MAFLPITVEEVEERGWDEIDFVFVTGDSYVDHPSFGVSIISRVLETKSKQGRMADALALGGDEGRDKLR